VEIQPEMAEMARRSVILNNLENRVDIIEGDFRKSIDMFGPNSFDAVVVNPPYTKAGSGLLNPDDAKAVSRHEIFCTLEDIIKVSAGLLKHHGRFFMIHRPERLVDIFFTMREYRIEPKRIQLVHANRKNPANMVLIFGLKNGNPQVTVEAPMYVNESDE
jgi:tRNA1(Val) A37 N6-methylase TrmN6